MPGTLWSAPVPALNVTSASPAVVTALADVSPSEVVLLPGQMNLGTRVRLFAQGEYTDTASLTLTIGFYVNQVGTVIGTTEVTLALGTITTSASATAWPWRMDYYGRFTAVSGPADTANAAMYGQGNLWVSTSLTAWTQIPIPATAAARTVTQTATGLLTTTAQKVMVGTTWSATTGATFTCDELTCELLG